MRQIRKCWWAAEKSSAVLVTGWLQYKTERSKRMKHAKLVRGIALFAACALLLPVTMGAKKQVTRPFMVNGNVTVTFTESTADYLAFELLDVGQATHLGRYCNRAEGKILLTGPDAGRVLTSGTCTGANGDSFYWDSVEVMGTDRMMVSITGGTGRFTDAGGEFVCDRTPFELAPVVTFTYKGEGTIRY